MCLTPNLPTILYLGSFWLDYEPIFIRNYYTATTLMPHIPSGTDKQCIIHWIDKAKTWLHCLAVAQLPLPGSYPVSTWNHEISTWHHENFDLSSWKSRLFMIKSGHVIIIWTVHNKISTFHNTTELFIRMSRILAKIAFHKFQWKN